MDIDLVIVRTGIYIHSLPPSVRVVSRFHVKRNKLVATHQHTAILRNHALLVTLLHSYTLRIRVGGTAKYGLA